MTHTRPGDRVRAPRSRIMVHVAAFLRQPAADELETLKTLLRRVIDGLTAEDVKAAGGGDPVRHPGLP